jgi:hypothetical protein
MPTASLPAATETLTAKLCHVVLVTLVVSTFFPATFTTICGAPSHWSPLARTTICEIAPLALTILLAVSLPVINSAWPPSALESVKARALLESDSAIALASMVSADTDESKALLWAAL